MFFVKTKGVKTKGVKTKGVKTTVVKAIAASALLSLLLMGCQEITDDLSPSGSDQRPDVLAGSIGTQVDQQSPDFAVQDTLGVSRALSTELASADAVVLYFTMWCPICDSHASHMRAATIPDFPQVSFFLVDYVTGSITASRSAQLSNGYGSSTVLVDVDQSLFDVYQASMGTTVVIDNAGIVQMNEDYKDGVKLRAVLESLP
jgi:peroxiredoxin